MHHEMVGHDTESNSAFVVDPTPRVVHRWPFHWSAKVLLVVRDSKVPTTTQLSTCGHDTEFMNYLEVPKRRGFATTVQRWPFHRGTAVPTAKQYDRPVHETASS